jgi:hypothetical protein
MAVDSPHALAGYREAVTDLVKSGARFGDIEDAIDGIADLATDERDALWLLAFSLNDRYEDQRQARAHLAALQ